MRVPYIESKIEYTFIEKLRLRFQTVFIILCGKTRKNLFVRWSINFHIEKKTFHVLPSNRTKFQKVTQRSLRTFYVHLMFTKKKKKHLRETRKCLIFNVDQPGLEICCYDATHRADVCCRLRRCKR